MRYRVYPYKLGSRSATLLSTMLGGLKVRPDGNYRPRNGDLIINWGSSVIPNWWNLLVPGSTVLNHPNAVGNASHKLRCLRTLTDAGVPTLQWTTSREEANSWNDIVYSRHRLQGHSGEGIEVTDMFTPVPQAPLYTRGIENYGEYRVHVFNGEVIEYRKKVRTRDDSFTREEDLVRSHDNGWIFQRTNLRRLDRVEDIALRAVRALELDFGAVDIIMDEQGAVYVLEVNTACGLDDSTLSAYLRAIVDYAS